MSLILPVLAGGTLTGLLTAFFGVAIPTLSRSESETRKVYQFNIQRSPDNSHKIREKFVPIKVIEEAYSFVNNDCVN